MLMFHRVALEGEILAKSWCQKQKVPPADIGGNKKEKKSLYSGTYGPQPLGGGPACSICCKYPSIGK